MGPTRNARVIFNSLPTGFPEPGKTFVYDDTKAIDLDNVPLNGGFLIKTLVLSIDPYMRARMRDPEIESYVPAFTLGEPLVSHGLGVVIRSELPDLKVGDRVYGVIPHEEYTIFKSHDGLRVIQNKEGLPWSVYVGAAGMAGMAAFFGWKEYSHAKKGETVFITTGGGPVGSLVIQLAKLDGLKVIASAGSEEKVNLMKEIGADVAFNYKTTKTADVLRKEGPIDIYWDNVGGEILDAAMEAANTGGRIIGCGAISGYNEGRQPVKNMHLLFEKSLSMNGFIFFRLQQKYDDEFYATIPAKLASGELKYSEDVTRGLDKVGDVILAVQKGTNKAKAVIQVADD